MHSPPILRANSIRIALLGSLVLSLAAVPALAESPAVLPVETAEAGDPVEAAEAARLAAEQMAALNAMGEQMSREIEERVSRRMSAQLDNEIGLQLAALDGWPAAAPVASAAPSTNESDEDSRAKAGSGDGQLVCDVRPGLPLTCRVVHLRRSAKTAGEQIRLAAKTTRD